MTIDSYDDMMLPLIKRALPNISQMGICVADEYSDEGLLNQYDRFYSIFGVQPMAAPSGMIFTMTNHYSSDEENDH